MYSLETLISLAFVALVIGLIAGAVITQRLAHSKQSQHDLEKHLDELKQQQKNYQQEVAEHFSETGQLLNQLSKSYRNVHNHLANGAQTLAAHKEGDIIGILPENDTDKIKPTDEHNIMPPLDYAPKSTPDEKGMLNEQFGLDKVDTDNHSEASIEPTPQQQHSRT